MKIQDDVVVSMSYTLTEEGGAILEQNEGGIPMAYLHGRKNILAGLEAALEGHQEGDVVTVTLPPEQAYGPTYEGARQKVPIKHIVSKFKRLLPGMLVKVNTEKGVRDARVIKSGRFMVEIDTNHPFAGKTLTFNVVVRDVREATPEELAHGHAHGLGGHDH